MDSTKKTESPIRPGGIYIVGGVPSLVLETWDEGETWIMCPLKSIPENIVDDDDPRNTGRIVFVETSRNETDPNLDFADWVLDLGPYGENRYEHRVMEALPELGTTIYPQFVGAYRGNVYPKNLERARKVWKRTFADVKEPAEPDIDCHPYSREDRRLADDMGRESLEYAFVYEADAYVFDDEGNPHLETEEQRQKRIREYERKLEKRRKCGV